MTSFCVQRREVKPKNAVILRVCLQVQEHCDLLGFVIVFLWNGGENYIYTGYVVGVKVVKEKLKRYLGVASSIFPPSFPLVCHARYSLVHFCTQATSAPLYKFQHQRHPRTLMMTPKKVVLSSSPALNKFDGQKKLFTLSSSSHVEPQWDLEASFQKK